MCDDDEYECDRVINYFNTKQYSYLYSFYLNQ